MGQEYSWEVRERAEELYIVEGYTFEQAAAATGVSESQLKRWSAEDNWGDRKKEYRQALGEIRRNTVLLRKKLIAQALASGEPQDVYAAARLEAVYIRGRAKDQEGSQPGMAVPQEEAREIKTPQDAVTALEEVVAKRLNAMLTQPGLLTFAAIKDLKQTLGLIDELKAKYRPEAGDGPAPGLSDEAADKIRRQILGVA